MAMDESSGRRVTLKVIVDNLEELLAVALLFLIGASMAVQVFMRTVFSAPLSWPEELSQFMFVWASVLGAVGAAKRLGLVRVETLAEKLPAGVRKVLELLILVAVAVLLGVLGWQGWQMAARTTYAATTLPITWWWMYSAAAVFSVLIYARLLQVQLFRYRFTYIETVVAAKSRIVAAGSTS
jgi:TRAP-type C4-dicarboxylate transport system permease small subunit